MRFDKNFPEPRMLDHTEPALLAQYIKWLAGFIKRGGSPTHFYNYPFDGGIKFQFALSSIIVDSYAEFGASSRNIIVPVGLKASRTDPDGSFGGWGHTNLFFMDKYTVLDSKWVPVYCDSEFDIVLTKEHRKLRDQEQQQQQNRRLNKMPSGSNYRQETNDTALLKMLSGANFAPGASLTLPSGKKIDADEAQVFISLYSNDTTED